MYPSCWISIILVIILVGGCSTSRKSVREKNLTLSVQEVFTRVEERNRAITTLRGDGSITIESPEFSNSGSFHLQLRQPDSLLLELSGPFGIRVGTLMLARERFIYYNAMNNQAVVGKPDGSQLGNVLNMKLEFDEILRAFTGEFGRKESSEAPDQFTNDGMQYIVRYRDPQSSFQREYRIDATDFFVSSYRIMDSTGKPILTALASEPSDIAAEDEMNAGTVLPSLIRVIFPQERRSITVAYDDVTANQPVQCSFSVPPQADIIYR